MLRNCIFGLLLAASLNSHAAVRTVIVQPGQLTPTYGPGVGGDAFIDGRDWNATISDQKGSRHTVPVTLEKKYSWVSFRGALKNALKVNPGQLALTGVITGALAGVDYIFDNSGPVPVISKKDQPDSAFGFPITNSSSFQGSCNGIDSFARGFHSSAPGNYQYIIAEPAYTANGFTYSNNCGPGYRVSQRPYAPFDVTPGIATPITDSELDDFLSGINNPSDAAALAPVIESSVPGSFDYPDSETFGGPNSIELPTVESTSLDQVSGDTVVKQETTTLDLVYSKNPLSVTATPTTVTNTYQNGTLTNTTTNTVTGPTVDAQPLPEVPTDCEFMPTVCEWLAWFKEPIPTPDVELPTPEDQDFEKTYSANFGGGCPPPRQIALTLFPPVQFSWGPLCDFAGYLKFLVVGGAALMAAFIGLGISRGNA